MNSFENKSGHSIMMNDTPGAKQIYLKAWRKIALKLTFIADSEGTWVEDVQTLSRLFVRINAIEGSKRSRGYAYKGGTLGYENYDLKVAEDVAREAARIAIAMLPAEDAPAGEYPIVMAKGHCGTFFHEAIVHSLESDGIRKKTSCFWDKKGKQIASDISSLADDGTVLGARGAINVDDEGTPGQKTVLIDKGILKMFIYDSITARKAGVTVNTLTNRRNYRSRASAGYLNIVVQNGNVDRKKIISGIKNGFYVTGLRGIGTDSTTGTYSCGSSGFWIKDGEIAFPVDGVTLGGNVFEMLKNIEVVANDIDIRSSLNTPSFKISEMTTGGKK